MIKKVETLNRYPRVVVLGAGFGGLRTVHALSKAPVEITIIDRNNYHLFQPLLYQVATAGLSPDEIAHPLRMILRPQKNITFRLAEVQDIDLASRKVYASTGTLSYDYLVVSVGGMTNYFKMPGVEHNSFGLKSLQDAEKVRDHLLRQFELASQENDPEIRRAMLTFVVTGGGPTGVECAGAIIELVHSMIGKDYPDLRPEEVRVILLEASDHLLPAMPDSLRETAQTVLKHKGAEIHYGYVVTDFDGQKVMLKDGQILPARTLIWAAGARAAALIDRIGGERGSLGRIKVEPTLQLPGHPEVFVIGDAAYVEDEKGIPLPMVAPVAMQQGTHTAKNILRLLKQQPLQTFQYHDPGTMSTIGRNQAVAYIGGVKLRGFIAWMAWLVVHIWQLIGFRNRLLVMFDWAWQYVTFDRAVRLIQSNHEDIPPPIDAGGYNWPEGADHRRKYAVTK